MGFPFTGRGIEVLVRLWLVSQSSALAHSNPARVDEVDATYLNTGVSNTVARGRVSRRPAKRQHECVKRSTGRRRQSQPQVGR